MKKITLEKVLWSLEDMKFEIELDRDVIERAKKAIEGIDSYMIGLDPIYVPERSLRML